MSELIKSYDNAAGRTAQVRYDTAHHPRPKRILQRLCNGKKR